nr:hypothetical protein CFP56_13424 [Quercus suber]
MSTLMISFTLQSLSPPVLTGRWAEKLQLDLLSIISRTGGYGRTVAVQFQEGGDRSSISGGADAPQYLFGNRQLQTESLLEHELEKPVHQQEAGVPALWPLSRMTSVNLGWLHRVRSSTIQDSESAPVKFETFPSC